MVVVVVVVVVVVGGWVGEGGVGGALRNNSGVIKRELPAWLPKGVCLSVCMCARHECMRGWVCMCGV